MSTDRQDYLIPSIRSKHKRPGLRYTRKILAKRWTGETSIKKKENHLSTGFARNIKHLQRARLSVDIRRTARYNEDGGSKMDCPKCHEPKSRVVYTRRALSLGAGLSLCTDLPRPDLRVRRRRCLGCDHRWSTHEVSQDYLSRVVVDHAREAVSIMGWT